MFSLSLIFIYVVLLSPLFRLPYVHLCCCSLSSISFPLIQIQFHQNVCILRTFFLFLTPFYQQKWQLLLLNVIFSFPLKVSHAFICHINCVLISEILIFMKLQPKGGRWVKLDKLMTNHCSWLYFLIFSTCFFFLGNQRFMHGA